MVPPLYAKGRYLNSAVAPRQAGSSEAGAAFPLGLVDATAVLHASVPGLGQPGTFRAARG